MNHCIGYLDILTLHLDITTQQSIKFCCACFSVTAKASQFPITAIDNILSFISTYFPVPNGYGLLYMQEKDGRELRTERLQHAFSTFQCFMRSPFRKNMSNLHLHICSKKKIMY